MNRASFTQLPTELLCGILASVSSSHDLLSLLLAAPQLYRAFQTAKENTLSNVAYRSLQPGILTPALTSLRCLEWRPRSTGNTQARDSDEIECLFRIICTAQSHVLSSLPIPLSETSSLFRYQHAVESLVQDYASSHLAKYGGPPLSSTELHRLRRGFYRYDTLQSANCLQMGSRGGGFPVETWANLCKQCAASPWEVEEVACVYSYFVERLESLLDMIEQNFVDEVVSSTQETARVGGDPDATRWYSAGVATWRPEHPLHFFKTDLEEDWSFFWDSEKGYQRKYIDHLAMLGIPFLRHILQVSDSKMRRAIVLHNRGLNLVVLPDALFQSSYHRSFLEERIGYDNGSEIAFEGDAIDKRNLGWLWANQYRPSPYYSAPCDADFRTWGYVFWDQARLDHLNVIREPCPRVERHRTPPQLRNRSQEESVEQRLRKMGLVTEAAPVI